MILKNKTLKEKIVSILNYYKVKNYDKLIEEAKKILKKKPNIDLLWNAIGLSYQQKGELDKAEKNFLTCLQVNPENMSAINNLGNNYKYLFNYSKAEECFERVLKKNPKYLVALVNYGNLKFELNKFSESLELLEKAYNLDSNSISVKLNLALVYQSIGEYEKALNHLKEINTLNPTVVRADKMISALINYNENNEHLHVMDKKLKELTLENDQKVYLHFALGKAYEDQENYQKAMEHIELGNQLKMRSSEYNLDREKALFKNIKDLFINYDFNKHKIKNSRNRMIFILGMPRSGTTLVEQIISSHPDVYGAGELSFLPKLVYKNFLKLNKINFIENFHELNNNELSLISNQYYNFIENFNTNKTYITDKALFNFQWIGFIKILFPEAKIINCIRDPKDNCFSIYKNLFENEGHWCYNKEELVECYKLYTDLMIFWNDKLPEEIYNIKYEDLVANPEPKIRELISMVGLDWNEKCLKYNENKNAIKTLSVNQARKKIYSSSVKSYDRYKDFTKNFFSGL